MTTEQLDEMTDHEKRIAIGQICGLSTEARPLWDCDCLNFRGTNYKTEAEARASMANWCKSPEDGVVWKNGQEWSDFFPDYLNSADAAVQLCDFAASKGWTCELNQGLNTCWECFFKRRTTERTETTREEFDGSLWEEHYFPADTLSEAISGAFLLTFLP